MQQGMHASPSSQVSSPILASASLPCTLPQGIFRAQLHRASMTPHRLAFSQGVCCLAVHPISDFERLLNCSDQTRKRMKLQILCCSPQQQQCCISAQISQNRHCHSGMLNGRFARCSRVVWRLQRDHRPAGRLFQVDAFDLLEIVKGCASPHCHLVGRIALIQFEVQQQPQLCQPHLPCTASTFSLVIMTS